MEPSPKQQTVELVKNAQNILVLGHHNPDGDAIGSVLALTLALRKLGKQTTPVLSDPVPKLFSFLPAVDQITADAPLSEEFAIILDTSEVEVDKLGYKNYPEEKRLKIVIKAKSGTFTPEKVSFEGGGSRPDLIFALDTNDLERLGAVYEKNPNLFYEVPVVNIDHHPGNSNFGKVNWVELTATSTAEILVSLIESLGTLLPTEPKVSLVDENIATLLLTGLITDTGSFQNTNTTPKSFTVAAQLVASGARQQDIIRHIYKTKPLSTLRLWGRILARLQEERLNRFVWSSATASDFAECGANEAESSGVIDELLKTVPDIDFALLLTEKGGNLYGSMRSVNKTVSVSQIAKLFGGGGHEMAAAFNLPNASLQTHRDRIIEQIRDYQAKRLNQTQQLESSPISFSDQLIDSQDLASTSLNPF